MAELNLNQIVGKLNEEFRGDTRKLVFWYDDNGDFAEDVDSMKLENAEIYHLTPTNQFRTKLFLERGEGKNHSYLLYAPFPKPPVEENHLEDTLLYSKRFYADRASLICLDLHFSEQCKPVIQKYIKFFGDKRRTQRFYDWEIENATEESIEIALMSVLCGSKVASFEETARIILTGGELEHNRSLAEFKKYRLTEAFWKQCGESFGYADPNPSLTKLVMTLFATYTAKAVREDLPPAWQPFLSGKPGNIMVFLDSLMNNVLYTDRYDALSALVEKKLSAEKVFSNLSADAYVECDTFLCVDRLLMKWMNECLLNENTGATLSGASIPQICELRRKKHFARKTATSYDLMESAWYVVRAASYQPAKGLKGIARQYTSSDYQIDRWYRRFIYSLDQLEEAEAFDPLRRLVENIYTNEYLGKLLPAWNEAFCADPFASGLPLERRFYDTRVRNTRERVVVILSDAMRYEVGAALAERLEQDPNSTVSLEAQLSVLPSFTPLGMASLLPHKTLEMTEDYKVLADGKSTAGTTARQEILHLYQPQSLCVKFSDLKQLKSAAELRRIFTSRQVIYVYHNQIDARGENLQTEDEVFSACEETVEEIASLIHRIAVSGNTYRFLITSDHGFLYKREPLAESAKITGKVGKAALTDRRFILDREPVSEDGVASVSLGKMLGNEDLRQVSFPVSTDVFKTGGGMNYVHGGSSPQEMILPVLDVKMERYHKETHTVEISLLSVVRKITNLITSLDFIQSEPVSDTVTATTYRIFFVSEKNERITNENILTADSREEDPAKRVSRLRFTFKNQHYDSRAKYYLVAVDRQNGLEAWRREMVLDIAFADDFGFGF